MLASMLMNFLIDGIGTGFGMLYGEFLAEFGASKSTTAFVGSLLSGMYLLCGKFEVALAFDTILSYKSDDDNITVRIKLYRNKPVIELFANNSRLKY